MQFIPLQNSKTLRKILPIFSIQQPWSMIPNPGSRSWYPLIPSIHRSFSTPLLHNPGKNIGNLNRMTGGIVVPLLLSGRITVFHYLSYVTGVPRPTPTINHARLFPHSVKTRPMLQWENNFTFFTLPVISASSMGHHEKKTTCKCLPDCPNLPSRYKKWRSEQSGTRDGKAHRLVTTKSFILIHQSYWTAVD